MHTKTLILILIPLCFASCKTYEVVHGKGTDIDKIKNVSKYTVYLHSKSKIFQVNNPTLSADGLKGGLTPITDKDLEEEIRNPETQHQLKKHRHDLNVITKTEIKDSAVALKKTDISEVSVVVSHAHVNWDNVGTAVNTVIASAMCVAFLGALVYWFSLGFR